MTTGSARFMGGSETASDQIPSAISGDLVDQRCARGPLDRAEVEVTLGQAYCRAAVRLADTGERGSNAAIRTLLHLANGHSRCEPVSTAHGAEWAALRMAAAALSCSPVHAAMSLLCAQLADEHGPL